MLIFICKSSKKVKTICEDTANIPEFNKYFTEAQAEEYANL